MSSKSPAIELFHLWELEKPKGGRWLIHEVLPKRGLAVLWGAPKSKKTFWALNVAYHVATGKNWMGLATKQGPVVYAAFEGQDGIYYRLNAIRRTNGGEDFPVITCLRRLVFNKDRKRSSMAHVQLIDAIASKCDTLQLGPALIILDTLARSFDGSENEPDKMAFYTQACLELAEQFDCLVMCIHSRRSAR